MIVAIDFDQTIYSEGEEVPGAIAALKQFQQHGAKIVLWTNRTLVTLWWAKAWCKKRGIKFSATNRVWWQWIIPWSPKIYADAFVDDRNGGAHWSIAPAKNPLWTGE